VARNDADASKKMSVLRRTSVNRTETSSYIKGKHCLIKLPDKSAAQAHSNVLIYEPSP